MILTQTFLRAENFYLGKIDHGQSVSKEASDGLLNKKKLPRSQNIPKNWRYKLHLRERISRPRRVGPKWLQVAQTSSLRELDKEVVKVCPKALIKERLIPKAKDRNELRLGVSDAFEGKLKKAQDLVSRQQRRSVSLEVTLEEALNTFLEKFSARRKVCVKTNAKTSQKHLVVQKPGEPSGDINNPPASKDEATTKINRRETNKTLTPKTKRWVLERDHHRCQHINARGERCSNTRFLDIHHLIQRARGGTHRLENLTTLCSAHHHWLHKGKGEGSRPLRL